MGGGSPRLGDVIRRFGAALLFRCGGALTSAQDAVLSILARCHTAALGGHLYRCDACGEERAAYNSCGNRHCPSCLGHKSAAWLTARAEELLPVPYFHVVFTVPAAVAALALGNKRVVYGILFRAASETLVEAAANPKHLGARLGFLAILHTWTQTLLHHPHVHCVVPGGGLSPDGTRWVASGPRFFLPIRVLSRLYRGKFLAYLREAVAAGELHFGGSTAELEHPLRFDDFVREHREMEWVVYAKRPFGSPTQVLKYLAAYTHRVAVSDRRLVKVTAETVTFRYRDRQHGDRRRVMTLCGVEFLRRFLLHVLPKGFVRIRYYGFLANAYRAKNLAWARGLVAEAAFRAGTPPPIAEAPAEAPAPAPAVPRTCPVCGVGQLRLVRELDKVPLVGPSPWARAPTGRAPPEADTS